MKHLRSMLADAVSHVKNCPLCRGKGFVCEFCQKSEDIIFPFELYKVSKCKGEHLITMSCTHMCMWQSQVQKMSCQYVLCVSWYTSD